MEADSMLDFGVFATENSLMHADRKPDFSGWATKANLKCSDGRTILPDAFKHQDTAQVPLVWQHAHQEVENVLGHAILENRPEGVYCYGYFNESPSATHAKLLVKNKEISSLSIFANGLVEKMKQVSHGIIREVSLVLAGANPGALIDNLELAHSDGSTATLDDEAVIYTGLTLEHEDKQEKDETVEHDTLQEVYDDMSDDQKGVVHYMVASALKTAGAAHSDTDDKDEKDKKDKKAIASGDTSVTHNEEEGRRMSRNVFEQQQDNQDKKHTLSHDDLKGIVDDAKKIGSLKEALDGYVLKHGIENIDVLFPDAKQVGEIEWDKRRTEWVAQVWNGVRKSPFSRIKSIVADITHEEARARGYIKGTFKKEEFFGLVKRTTAPTTVYKKQKLDRDDVIDIVDLDVVAWMKGEMRLMLDEELCRAIMIGDGREIADDDKIRDPAGQIDGIGIRSILNEHDLYAATVNVNDSDANSKPSEIVDTILLNMDLYKGSGAPTFYTTQRQVSLMLLERDNDGKRLYRTASELAAEMGVSGIVVVEVFETVPDLVGIIVNLNDYTIGADRGGEINMFDDFDIDYNQLKYLIETRVSGALTKIRSALVVKRTATAAVKTAPESPTFVEATGVITPKTTTGVTYKRADTNAVVTTAAPITLTPGQSLKIYAVPSGAGYFFENNVRDEFTFKRPAA